MIHVVSGIYGIIAVWLFWAIAREACSMGRRPNWARLALNCILWPLALPLALIEEFFEVRRRRRARYSRRRRVW